MCMRSYEKVDPEVFRPSPLLRKTLEESSKHIASVGIMMPTGRRILGAQSIMSKGSFKNDEDGKTTTLKAHWLVRGGGQKLRSILIEQSELASDMRLVCYFDVAKDRLAKGEYDVVQDQELIDALYWDISDLPDTPIDAAAEQLLIGELHLANYIGWDVPGYRHEA